MFTSEAVHRHNGRASERRSSRRTTLQWVVLVFFGQDHWGKLIDLSEKGMRFQFEHPPALQGPINFTFEAMGCTAIPQEGVDGKLFGDSIQATGRVVWTRDFERTAGVQFLNLSPKSRDQIRYWISSGTTQDATAPSEEPNNVWNKVWGQDRDNKASTPFTPASFRSATFAPPEPKAPFAEAPSEFPTETFESDLEDPESNAEVVWEPEHSAPTSADEPATFQTPWPREPQPEPTFAAPNPEDAGASFEEWPAEADAEPTFTPATLEERVASQRKWPLESKPEPALAPEGLRPVSQGEGFWQPRSEFAPQAAESMGFGMLPHEERQRRGQTLELKQKRARVGFVAILSFLATVGAVAGIIKFTSKFNEGPEVSEGDSHALQSSMGSTRAETAAATENASSFLVEVLEANNRRSVLLFSDAMHPGKSAGLAQELSQPALSVNYREAPKEERAPASKSEEFHDFTLVAPHASGSGLTTPAASSAVPDAPPLAPGIPASSDAPLRETLPSPAAPEAGGPIPVGGDVQPARLIRAMLPSYPQIARANRVAGEVTLDALVDEHGNVRDVKVISGPLLLREAAKEALRQWKYEPARLDGRATAMHLTVTVKFQDDQAKR